MLEKDELATLSLHIQTDRSKNKVSIYQQIVQQIKHLIESGRLKSGERLPSSRQLAQWLNISRTSTVTAYEQLIAEGLLTSRPASGIYVTALADALYLKTNEQKTTIEKLPTYHSKASQFLGMAFDAGADPSLFPHKSWAKCLSQVWQKPDLNWLRDHQSGGFWGLREAVSLYVKRMRGIDCRPEQVIISAGNRDALSLINHSLLSPGQRVGIEDPCYPPIRAGFKQHEIDLKYFPVDRQGIQLPLDGETSLGNKNIQLAWMTPARQYPLGMEMSIERRLAWLDYSQAHSCWLVEDDYDSEFQYRKTPLAPLFQLQNQLYSAEQAKVIYVGSFSKVMFRTLRIGFIIVPESLIERFIVAQKQLGAMASVPVQPALTQFLNSRPFVSHLRRIRGYYQRRQNYLYDNLMRRFGNKIECGLPDLGMHLLMRFRRAPHCSDQAFEQQLKQMGIMAPALSRHYQLGSNQEQCETVPQGLLLGFSGCEEAQLDIGLNHLQTLMEQ